MLRPDSISLRPATQDDLPFLWDMLFESAFTTDEQRAAWRRDRARPAELRKYLDEWPREGDAGFIAIDAGGAPAGAAWYRMFRQEERGDGILAAGAPELAIAVAPERRRRGVGAMLLRALIAAAAGGGHGAIMLSVDPTNAPALALYARMGFTRLVTDDAAAGTSWIMTAPANASP
jgi:ribosomal protein S18 acetylase RimI-like enzyme